VIVPPSNAAETATPAMGAPSAPRIVPLNGDTAADFPAGAAKAALAAEKTRRIAVKNENFNCDIL
jgi:hypothetical protein